MKTLHLGLTAWKSARRQLQAAGYLTDLAQTRPTKGRFGSLEFRFNAEPVGSPSSPVSTVGGLPAHGGAAHGGSVHGESTHITRTQEQEHKNKNNHNPRVRGKVGEPTAKVQEIQGMISWAVGVDDAVKRQCAELLVKAGVDAERGQQLVDELAGRMAARPVANPVGYLRTLIKQDRSAEGLTLELAAGVAAARRARDADRKRQALAATMSPSPASPAPDRGQPQPRAIMSDAAHAERARLRELRLKLGRKS